MGSLGSTLIMQLVVVIMKQKVFQNKLCMHSLLLRDTPLVSAIFQLFLYGLSTNITTAIMVSLLYGIAMSDMNSKAEKNRFDRDGSLKRGTNV